MGSSTATTNSPMALVAVIGILVVVVIVVIVLAIKRREEVFEGEVIDKNIIETVRNNMPMNGVNGGVGNNGINIINGGVQHEYMIKVRTVSGKVINYKISSGMYEVIKIGDTVSKPKGTTEITITSSRPVGNSAENTLNPPKITPDNNNPSAVA